MRLLALLLLGARAAPPCCWLVASKSDSLWGSRGEGLVLRPEACDGGGAAPERCFVSCLVLRTIAAERCACDDARVAAEQRPAPEPRRRLSKTNAFSGGWIAPRAVVERGDWDRGGPLEAGSFLAFAESDAVFRTAAAEGFRAVHVSAYEHSVVARAPFDAAMAKVAAVLRREGDRNCAAAAAPPFASPLRAATAAVVPFYGGNLSGGRKERLALTGNAHSLQPRALKLAGLRANLCALLRDAARAVLVATCAEVAGDGAAVAAYLDAALPPDLRRRVALDDGPCGKPRDLPFRAVKALLARYPDDAFLAFNEADLLWDYASAAFANATAELLFRFPSAMVTPHRWHKKYGSDPACGHACGLQATGQNLCHLGSNVYAVARV